MSGKADDLRVWDNATGLAVEAGFSGGWSVRMYVASARQEQLQLLLQYSPEDARALARDILAAADEAEVLSGEARE